MIRMCLIAIQNFLEHTLFLQLILITKCLSSQIHANDKLHAHYGY